MKYYLLVVAILFLGAMIARLVLSDKNKRSDP